MTLPAIDSYDDEKLEALRIAVLTEQDRRANLARIPDQITTLAATYVEGGGDVGDLTLEPDQAAAARRTESLKR